MPPSAETPLRRALSPGEMARSHLCIGCGACAASTGAGMAMDRYGQLKPARGAPGYDRPSLALAEICPFAPAAADETRIAEARFAGAPWADPRIGRYEAAYVGFAAEGDFRPQGSSGGMVSWTAAELLRTGLVDGVAHVAPTGDPERLFAYRISRNLRDLAAGARSRYYPVELSQVLAEIRRTPGRYAVVGVPCFIKSVHLLARQDPVLRERIAFTLGLFCGHSKSARMVGSFAWQMGVPPDAVERVEYRVKDPQRPANWYTAELGLRDGGAVRRDWWHLVDGDWGAGFFQNAACNVCDDVTAETADIAFGDAWVEPYASDGRGTNVVVARSPLLNRLLQSAIAEERLDLRPVDAEFVVATQAAGFRQRREGLALRLTWRRAGLRPGKRVAPASGGLPLRRRLIYVARAHISAWSHRVFLAASLLRRPGLYVRWAAAMAAVYQGLAYSRGPVGAFVDRLERLGAGFRQKT
jgi:coenzyme F420-reducing hydrogenase beta subunit